MARRRAVVARYDLSPSARPADLVAFPSSDDQIAPAALRICTHSTHTVPLPTLSVHSAPLDEANKLRHTSPARGRRHSSLPAATASAKGKCVPFPTSDCTPTIPRDSGYGSNLGTLKSALKKRDDEGEGRWLSGPQRVGDQGQVVVRRKHRLAMQFAKLDTIGIPAYTKRNALSSRFSSATDETDRPSSRLTVTSHGPSSFSSECTVDSPASPSREAALEAKLGQERQESLTADYLCYVSQIKAWMAQCILIREGEASVLSDTGSDGVVDFERSLQSGYLLALLARILGGPSCEGRIYQKGAHPILLTENVNIFFNLLREKKVDEEVWFESMDLIEGRNLPKVVYCLFALATKIHQDEQGGRSPRLARLSHHVRFSPSTVSETHSRHQASGIELPDFAALLRDSLASCAPPTPISPTFCTRANYPPSSPRSPYPSFTPSMMGLQAQVRGVLARRRMRPSHPVHPRVQELSGKRANKCDSTGSELLSGYTIEGSPSLSALQAHVRAKLQRERFLALREFVVRLQARARCVVGRRSVLERLALARKAAYFVKGLQRLSRGCLVRRSIDNIRRALSAPPITAFVVAVQTRLRGYLVRRDLTLRKLELWIVEPLVVKLQAICRRRLARSEAQRRGSVRVRQLWEKLDELQKVAKTMIDRRTTVEEEKINVQVDATTPRTPTRAGMERFRLGSGRQEGPVKAKVDQGLDKLSVALLKLLTNLAKLERELADLDTVAGIAVCHHGGSSSSKEVDEARWTRLVLERANEKAPLVLSARDPNCALLQRASYRIKLLLRVQHGADVSVLFEREVSEEDHRRWRAVRAEEERAGREGGLESSSFETFKEATKSNLDELRRLGVLQPTDRLAALMREVVRTDPGGRKRSPAEVTKIEAILAELSSKGEALVVQRELYKAFIRRSNALPRHDPHQSSLLARLTHSQRRTTKSATLGGLYDRRVLVKSINVRSPKDYAKFAIELSEVGPGEFELGPKGSGLVAREQAVKFSLGDLFEAQLRSEEELKLGQVVVRVKELLDWIREDWH